MHEATIAKSILDIADGRACKMPGANITVIRVRLGTFTNVDPESLGFAFDGLKGDYPACREAKLEMELVQTKAICLKRQHHYSPQGELGFRCNQCGSGIGRLLEGDELEVTGCVFSWPKDKPARKEKKHA